MDEMEKAEKANRENNDLYTVAARVKNSAREIGSLTPAGEALCNMVTHVLKSYYDFADTLDPVNRQRLIDLTRTHEKMPSNLISVLMPLRKK